VLKTHRDDKCKKKKNSVNTSMYLLHEAVFYQVYTCRSIAYFDWCL